MMQDGTHCPDVLVNVLQLKFYSDSTLYLDLLAFLKFQEYNPKPFDPTIVTIRLGVVPIKER